MDTGRIRGSLWALPRKAGINNHTVRFSHRFVHVQFGGFAFPNCVTYISPRAPSGLPPSWRLIATTLTPPIFDWSVRSRCSQGLKPASLLVPGGTAEAVAFPNGSREKWVVA